MMTCSSSPNRLLPRHSADNLSKVFTPGNNHFQPLQAGIQEKVNLMIAVIFEVTPQMQSQKRYLELASELAPLLSGIPGFISVERFLSLNTPEKLLSLSWWENLEAVEVWKQNIHHLAAQQEGKHNLFSCYRISVTSVIRDERISQ